MSDLRLSDAKAIAESPKEAIAIALVLLAEIAESLDRLASKDRP